MLEVRRSITALLTCAAVVACSGGEDDGGTTGPTPAIEISVAPTTQTVTQGGTASVTVTLTRSGGFTGAVTLATTGLTTGLTAPDVTIAAGATTGVVTYTASATATAGTANTTITASGTGVTSKTAAVAVTVNAAPTPTYTLAATAATANAGGTGTSNITITRTGGFAGAVTLAAEGLPTGVTAAFNPNNTTTNASVLTLTAAANATPGTSTITVRGTATGQTDKTTTFQLTVNAAGTSSYTLAASAATVVAGATGNSNITITRTGGFAGAVTLAAEGLPTGVTAAFNPNNTTTDASVLTFTAAANAAAGTSTITVRGTATGQTDKTATLQLTVTAAAGSYTLAITEPNLTIAAGATTTANITIARTGGFAGAVALTVENLPTGVTGTFNPQSVTANSSVLTLTAAANAAPVGQSILVRGISGQENKSASVLLTVTAAAGNFTLSVAPTTVPVQQGGTGNTTVTINRTGGFAGTVNLTATGLPTGVTAAFNPAAATANTSTLTLTATGTATVGQATVTVRGNSGTLAEQTATVTVNVTAATGGSGNTVYEFCTASQTPLWLAVQNDAPNGTWVRVTPTGTKFQFNVTGAKAAVAYVTGSASGGVSSAAFGFAGRMARSIEQDLRAKGFGGRRTGAYAASSMVDGFALSIIYGSQTELNATGTSNCLPGTGKTVNGTVVGVSGATQSANVSLGPKSASVSGSGSPNFTLTDVPDGALDLIATRANFNLTTFAFTVDKLIIRRGLNQANNSTITPNLDFNAAEAVAPLTPALTVANLGAEQASVSSFYFTSAGSRAAGAPLALAALPVAGPYTYAGVPADKQVAGDLHMVQVQALPNATSFDQFRYAGIYFKDATARTATLGAALTAPTITVPATTPYVRFRATGPVQTEYNKFINIQFSQGTSTSTRLVSILASTGFLTGLTTYDFTVPDFTGVAGWDNNWGPKTGAQTTWFATAYGYTGIGFGSAQPLEGATFTGAGRTATLTP